MATLTRQAILGDEFADLFADAAPSAAAAAVDRDVLCDKLTANLRSQLELYVAYKALAERQRLALINRRLAENVDVNGEVDKLLNSLGGLEEERIALTGSIIGRAAGDASTPVKCEAIYPLVSADRAARLKDCRDALVEAVGELKRVLAVNQALVENGSKIIHTTIGILTSVAGRTKADRMNTYTAKGNVQYGKVQIRNLVNRSV
jgi:hypothetical protein